MPSADVIETLAEEELKSGKEGLLMVPFHANPEPLNLTWYLDGLDSPLGMNETRDRFSSRGFIRYVSRTLTVLRLMVEEPFLYSEPQFESGQ